MEAGSMSEEIGVSWDIDASGVTFIDARKCSGLSPEAIEAAIKEAVIIDARIRVQEFVKLIGLEDALADLERWA